MLDNLPVITLDKVLSLLNTNDLTRLRCVSKRMHLLADKVIKSRKIELKINEDVELNKIKSQLNFFPNIRRVVIEEVNIEFAYLLQSLELNLKNVETFVVSYFQLSIASFDYCTFCRYTCNSGNVHSIGDHVSNLKELSLKNVCVTDDDMSHLFSQLRNLECITLISTLINGQCFSDIGDKVYIVNWSLHNLARLNPLISFNEKGKNIRQFSFQNRNNRSHNYNQAIITLISNELSNLQRWNLNVSNDNIVGFGKLKLHKLQELTVNANGLEDDDFGSKFMAVKRLTLNVSFITGEKLALFLSHFPNVEYLHIEIERFMDCSPSIASTLSNLSHLKTFHFQHIESLLNAQNVYDLNFNRIIETVNAMRSVCKFKLNFNLYCPRSVSAIVNEIKSIAEIRPEHSFHLVIKRNDLSEFNIKNLPANLIIDA